MPNKLILVDNTRQAAVMQAVLGKAWAVHVIPPSSIHLPKDQLGVDIDHDFQPDFQITGMLGEAIVALMLEINRRDGTTFIFSTHDPRVMSHAHRVVRLADGRIVEG